MGQTKRNTEPITNEVETDDLDDNRSFSVEWLQNLQETLDKSTQVNEKLLEFLTTLNPLKQNTQQTSQQTQTNNSLTLSQMKAMIQETIQEAMKTPEQAIKTTQETIKEKEVDLSDTVQKTRKGIQRTLRLSRKKRAM